VPRDKAKGDRPKEPVRMLKVTVSE
jgi:hypothetical protein